MAISTARRDDDDLASPDHGWTNALWSTFIDFEALKPLPFLPLLFDRQHPHSSIYIQPPRLVPHLLDGFSYSFEPRPAASHEQQPTFFVQLQSLRTRLESYQHAHGNELCR